MSLRSPRSRNRKGEGDRLRRDLMAAATSILREQGGAAGLSLREVSRRVGVSPPAVYLHFDSLEAIVDAVLVERFAELSQQLASAAAKADGDAAALRNGCRAYLDFAEREPEMYRLLFEGGIARSPAGHERTGVPPGRDAFHTLVQGLDRCQGNGTIPADDPQAVATLVWTALHGVATLRRAHPDFPWPPTEVLLDEILGRIAGLPRRN